MNNRNNMSYFIADLREKGVNLSSENGKIKFRAPHGIMTDDVKMIIKENKEAILELLNLEERTKKIILGDRRKKFKLTDVQSAYLLGRKDIFQFGNTACHIYMEIEYSDVLDEQRVEDIWNQLMKRHSMLRVTFEDTGCQMIMEDVPHYTLYTSRPENRLKTRSDIEEELGHKIYDIDVWPLFDIGCINSDNSGSLLIISIDFMLADWASIWILISEFEKLYRNKNIHLPELKYEFCDYIQTEQLKKSLPQYYIDKKYWMNRIHNLPPKPELPLRSKITNEVRFQRYKHILDREQWQSIIDVAKEIGVTPSAVVMTAYAFTISKWSENKHFLLNLTMLNRQDYGKDIENIVGDFTSVTLLEVDFSEKVSLAEAIKKLQIQLFSDIDHRLFSGIDVLREIDKMKGNDAALMPVVFTSGIGVVDVDKNGIIGRYNQNGISQTPQVFIDCQVLEQHGELLANWDVRENTLLPGVPEEMFKTFIDVLNVLSQGREKWESRVDDKNLLEHCEYDKMNLKEVSKKLLHTDILERAAILPDKIAVISRMGKITYGELAEKSRMVQNVLKEKGCLPKEYVGVAIPKSHYQVIAVMGILLSGAAYVPIDLSQPQDRIKRIISKAQIQHVISISTNVNDLPDNIDIINIDELREGKVEKKEVISEVQAENPAYVIFTSGSTGDPKGVVISHMAAVNTITQINKMLCVNEKDSILGVSRLGFDLSVYDIFGILSAGGTLIYPEESRIIDPSHLYKLMVDHGVTIWNSVPAIFEMVMDYIDNEGFTQRLSIRKTMLSGDWIPLKLPDRILKKCGDSSEVISLGGATEAAIWSVYFRYRHLEEGWNSIPYGKALPNQQVFVLDADKKICPIGVKGDIYISGLGLAIEYLAEPKLTESSFMNIDGVRMYYTGDKGRYMQDGNIEFLGREDTQIKMNGYRIELGEIEANLEKINYVKRAGTIAKKIGSDKKLVAYIEKNSDCLLNDEKFTDYIKTEIKGFLPSYMEPDYYVVIETTPMTLNGKIDRKKLYSLEVKISEDIIKQDENLDYFSPVYIIVKEIWCELLQQDEISKSMDLHLLGADSLLMAQSVGKIRKRLSKDDFGIDIPFDVLLKKTLNTPNLSEIALFIEKKLNDNAKKEEVKSETVIDNMKDVEYGNIKIHKEGGDHAIIFFHAGLGTINEFEGFIHSICKKTKSTVISIALNNVDAYCSFEPEHLFEKIAIEYSEQIADLDFRHVRLMGHCIGGMIAFEAAKIMINKGIEVVDLSLIDSIPGMYNIEDEILIELMFLPVLNISYHDIESCNFETAEFMEYLAWLAKENNGTLRAVTDKNITAGRFMNVVKWINMLRERDFDDRIALYLTASKNMVGKELFSSLYRVFRQSTLASSYTPVPYFGNMRLFKADRVNEVIPENLENTITFWENNCLGTVDVIMVAGNHFTCIEDDKNIDSLADKIVLMQ